MHTKGAVSARPVVCFIFVFFLCVRLFSAHARLRNGLGRAVGAAVLAVTSCPPVHAMGANDAPAGQAVAGGSGSVAAR